MGSHYNQYIRQLAGVTLDATNVGQDVPTKIFSGFRNHRILARIRGTETLAGGPATALRNAGSPWARIQSIRLDEAGTERWNLTGLEARFLSEMVAPQPLPKAFRLSSFANGAQSLEESLILPFAYPPSVSPTETCFVERNAKNQTQVTFRWIDTATGAGNPLATSPGTVTPSGYTVSVEQVFDDAKMADPDTGVVKLLPPVFIPKVRVIQQQVTAANTQLPIELLTDKYLRGIIVHQLCDLSDVDDIVNKVGLVSDDRELISKGTNFEDLARAAAQDFGGGLFSFGLNTAAAAQPDTAPYLPISFQQNGRLSTVLNPRTDLNLRLELDVQPTAAAGASTSLVRIILLELERVAGYTTKNIPF